MSVASTGMCASFASAIASTALPVPRSSAFARTLAARDLFDHFEAAGRRAVMAGAEGKPGLDLDGEVAGAAAVAVMRAVHQKAPGADRLQALQRLRHPVDVGQDFAPIAASNAGFVQHGAQALLDGVGIVVGVERDFLDAARLVEIDDRDRKPSSSNAASSAAKSRPASALCHGK